MDTLVDQVEKRKIKFRPYVYIFSLLKNKNKINGALGLEIKTGKIICFQAKTVVLASGGFSRVFKRSSSRFWENNGDGIALARDAGCRFSDMEMFQFHPTGMVYPQSAEGVLVTEAVRGEGGILTNAKGERFMKHYDALRMELSARDNVARAIYTEVEAGRGTKNGGCWLDISHRPKHYILERLPKMYRQFKHYGTDISKQKMEVSPTAHYSMGGILTDHATGETDADNLFAIGEVTSGIHGANRLGGNSLAEICVFGRLTANAIAKKLKQHSKAGKNLKTKSDFFSKEELNQINQKIHSLISKIHSPKGKNPIQAKKQLQQLMWKHCGVARNQKGLKTTLKELLKFKKMKLACGKKLKNNSKLVAALDVSNMIPTCEMILSSALARKESRGAHYRTDYKALNPRFQKNAVLTPSKTGFKVSWKPVSKPSKRVQYFIQNKPKAATHLLE